MRGPHLRGESAYGRRAEGKLGSDLAEKCQAILDKRQRYNLWTGKQAYCLNVSPLGARDWLGFPWYTASGWQERSEELFNASAEVAKALGKNERGRSDDYPTGGRDLAPYPCSRTAMLEATLLRTRRIEAVRIPARHLVKSINCSLWKFTGHRCRESTEGRGTTQSHCGIRQDFWTCGASPTEFILDVDYGTPGEKLQPVRISAARNGTFSCVAVVSSDAAIKAPAAFMSDL